MPARVDYSASTHHSGAGRGSSLTGVDTANQESILEQPHSTHNAQIVAHALSFTIC